MEAKKLLSTREASEILGKSRESVGQYRKRGKLTAYRNGFGNIAYDEVEVRKLLEFLPVENRKSS